VVAAKTERLFEVYTTVPPVPNATEEESVPVKVRVLLTVRVFPFAIVRVADVAGAVIVTLLTVPAVRASTKMLLTSVPLAPMLYVESAEGTKWPALLTTQRLDPSVLNVIVPSVPVSVTVTELLS
jgi:hypothetical protein